ncbi:2460_t:CDS:2 [Cetraspora pellucida]|uniref:ATP-dependent DNA helicase n=1 Tax=Cetraspora pellucida TaxID=1433469 RepID=A0A9N9HHD3_9GLOM|nr:2460_t:CDS:2 [Cetraspora pellucida]
MSTGVKIDRELANGKNGVYTYRVQGSFYHRIGVLWPENGVEPCYLQIYIYDTQHELQHRINAIPNSNLDSTIIQNLTTICLSMLICADIPGLDQRTYNNLTASQVTAIWVNSEMPSNIVQKHDIVLHTNIDQYVHISELNRCYNLLAYPILFPYSEQGWAPYRIPYKNISLIPEITNVNIDSEEYIENENRDIIDETSDDDNRNNIENGNRYPKQFQNETSQEKNSYPIYHHRQNNHYVEIRVGSKIVNGSNVLTKVIEVNQNNRTTLTEYFRMNAEDPNARNLLYANFPLYYTWNKATKREISDVHQLWDENFEAMVEDFMHRGIPNGQFQIQATLQSLNILLQRHSKTVVDYDLPELLPETINRELPIMLIEELSYKVTSDDLAKANTLNESQRAVFDTILNLINQSKSGILFIDGSARSGKTYLYDCFLSHTKAFADYLLNIGNGTEPTIENNLIRLSNEIVIYSQSNEDSINSLIDAVYYNLAENATNTTFITERTILTSLNSDVEKLNKQIMAKYPKNHIRITASI